MRKEDVFEQLRDAYPDYPVKINEIEIPCVKQPERRARKKTELFIKAFYGRDSKQHGWLKWFAINYLGISCVDYEVELLLPYNKLGKWGNGSGKVLPKGHQWREVPGWRFQRADVCGCDVVIEVGNTYSRSLIEPLWSYAVKKTIWLPFQFENIHDDWTNFDHVNKAFLIERDRSKKIANQLIV